MKQIIRERLRALLHASMIGFLTIAVCQSVSAAPKSVNCAKFNIDVNAARSLGLVILPPPFGCTTRMSNGFPIPDPNCTPGAINPTLTAMVLRNPTFTTKCVRDNATSASQKAGTYTWYHIPHPKNNTGATQTCELDHLISLELGGADTLENIWPQCGPPGVQLRARYFKQKDIVENFLARQVKAGNMDLAQVQRGIAEDWTQYLDAAKKAKPATKRHSAKKQKKLP
jgi:hypothetical protein